MPRTLFVLLPLIVSLFTLMMPAKVVAGPPDEGAGEMVVDEVTTLRAEVQRLEKEVTNDEYKANDLAVARKPACWRLKEGQQRPVTRGGR